MTDSDSVTFDGELNSVWTKGMKYNNQLSAVAATKSVKPVDGTSAFEVPDEMFSNKKNSVFKDVSASLQ